jgi:pimeloyl-ACP methyl ester carboxylesterase
MTSSERVDIRGHRLEVLRIAGDAALPALVFLHEGLGSVSQWRDFPATVARATGAPVVVYSRLGHGQSDAVTLPRPLTFMREEARGDLPLLLAGIEGDVVLVGHSDGASIALIHAADGDARLRGVVAMAPHVFVEAMCVDAIARVAAVYETPTTDLRARLARHHADVDGVFRGWSGAWLDPGFTAFDVRALLPRVAVPVLVIQGDADEYGTEAQVDAIRRHAGGPVDALLLARCGHAPHRDRPGETRAAIAAFVARLADERARDRP